MTADMLHFIQCVNTSGSGGGGGECLYITDVKLFSAIEDTHWVTIYFVRNSNVLHIRSCI